MKSKCENRRVRGSINWRLAVGVFGAYLLLSCGMNRKLYSSEDKLVSYNWVLHAYQQEPIHLDAFHKGAPFLRFDSDSTVYVFTGCEYTRGVFRMAGESLDVDIDPEHLSCKVPASENLILFLNSSNRFVILKEKLFLMQDNTELLAFFTK